MRGERSNRRGGYRDAKRYGYNDAHRYTTSVDTSNTQRIQHRDIWYKNSDGASVVLSNGGAQDYSTGNVPSATDGRTVMNGLPTSTEGVYGIQQADGGSSRQSGSDSASHRNNNDNKTQTQTQTQTHNTLAPHASSESSSSSDASLSAGPIVGIVVGVLAFIFFALLFFGKYRRRVNRRRVNAYARSQGMARAQPSYGDSTSGGGGVMMTQTAFNDGINEDGATTPTPLLTANNPNNNNATLKSQHSRSYSEATNSSTFHHLHYPHLRKESNTSSLIPSETEKSNSIAAAPWFRGSSTSASNANTSDDSHSRNHSEALMFGMSRSDSDTSRFRKARNSFGSPLDML